MPVTDWQVVMGKYLASIGLICVLLLSPPGVGKSDVVAQAVLSQSPGLTTVKVALIHATDVTSFEMFSKVESALVVNGKPATDPGNAGNVVTADFGDPDDPRAQPCGAHHP